MFDLAGVSENGILCRRIQFIFCVFCPLAIVIQEIHRKDCFNKRKQETRMELFVLLSPVLREDHRRHFNIILLYLPQERNVFEI